MRHSEAEKLLGAYADGELDAAGARAVEAHLADCPRCRQALRELRRLAGQLQSWPGPVRRPEADAEFSARVLARLPARRPASAARRSARNFLFPAGMVAAGALVQAGAMLTLVVGLLFTLGALENVSAQVDQLVRGPLGMLSLGTLSSFTLPGWLGNGGLGRMGTHGVAAGCPFLPAVGWRVPGFVGLDGIAGIPPRP